MFLAFPVKQSKLLSQQSSRSFFFFFPDVCVIFVLCCWLKIPLASKNRVIWSALLYLCLGRAHATISCFLHPKNCLLQKKNPKNPVFLCLLCGLGEMIVAMRGFPGLNCPTKRTRTKVPVACRVWGKPCSVPPRCQNSWLLKGILQAHFWLQLKNK